MNFNSWEFLLFLPVVIAGYWFLPFRARWAWLLGASWFFYMSWDFRFIVLILLTTAVTYVCGLGIEKKPEYKKVWLMAALLICFGELVFFKYTNFLMEAVYGLLHTAGLDVSWRKWNILLPVGISFYTFQAVAYVIDVYRSDVKAEKHFGYYALFVAYFPQLVAGPIERSKDLLTQLKREQKFSATDLENGFRIMLCGFFRKCVVADTCGIYVNQVFGSLENAGGLSIFLAGLLFCIQMYCDFAGYSQIAMGAARMMGIRLTVNFDRPYLSLTYTEFFRRWHITLGRWFTDYVYIPLGGNRRGILRKLRNTVIVLFLCGLWHGASWNYVLWGLYAAFFMCLETIFKKPVQKLLKKLHIPEGAIWLRCVRRIMMMLIFVPAALLFRADGMQEVAVVMKKLFSGWKAGTGYVVESLSFAGIGATEGIILILCLACMYLIYYLEKYEVIFIGTELPEGMLYTYGVKMALYLFLVCAVGICWLYLSAGGDTSSFAYFQF